MPKEILEVEKTNYAKLEEDQPAQTVEEIMRIIQEAKTPGEGSKDTSGKGTPGAGASTSDPDDESEADVSGDYVEAV